MWCTVLEMKKRGARSAHQSRLTLDIEEHGFVRTDSAPGTTSSEPARTQLEKLPSYKLIDLFTYRTGSSAISFVVITVLNCGKHKRGKKHLFLATKIKP